MSGPPAAHFPSDDERLRPYVAGLAVAWLRDTPASSWRTVDGSLAFVDISGFTRLTERLAAQGKVGAEELAGILDDTFADLLAVAYAYGAQLVKWGGDAVLLLYSGDRHAPRACRAAHEMRRTLGRVGRLRTSAGPVALRMSVGIHSGTFHFFLAGSLHRELVVTGPGATIAARAEAAAAAGDIVVSASTAALLDMAATGPVFDEDLHVLLRAPSVPAEPAAPASTPLGIDVGSCLPAVLREHLLAGGTDAEHRLVAVAFVEFAGVDVLLERSGADVVAVAIGELVTATQQACVRHGVTFWETDISGDGGKIMLVAGAPHSIDDPAGALLGAAGEILGAAGDLSVRVGVNDGRVFFGGFGPHYRRTYSVKGDAVNLAARVMGKAASGEVWATESAVERSKLAFEASPLEPFAVKGKSLPVRAFRIGAIVRSSAEAVDDDVPLVGREREMRALDAVIADVRAGKGTLVEVVGEPGIGKSRLMQEIRRRYTDLSTVVVACDAYHSFTPYAPFRMLLRDLLAIPYEADPATAGATLTAAVHALAPALADWLPLLAVVADATVPPTAATDSIGEKFRKQRLEIVTGELLRELLPDPCLLIVEDAHLADEASADMLAHVSRDIGNSTWALVLTRRTAPGTFRPPEGTTHVRVDLVPLDDVSARTVLAIASDEFPLRPHESAQLTERAQGNPLFLLQLLHAARRTGSVEGLPDSVEGVVTASIDRLPPVDRRLLRAAAVLGARFEESVLAELVNITGALPLERLTEFLERLDDGAVTFRHGLVRDTAYEGLPYARRRDLHARAGEVLELLYADRVDERADLLSLHFLQAEKFPEAWRYAQIAGARAQEAYAYVEAARFYGHAISAVRHLRGVPAHDIGVTWERLGDVRLRLGEFDAAGVAYTAARQAFRGQPSDVARVQFRTAQVADLAADYPRALRWMSTARRTLSGADDVAASTLRAEISGFYGLIRHRQGHELDAVRWCRRAVAEAEAAGARPALAAALASLDVSETMLGRGDGHNTVRALAIWREVGDAWQEARAHNNLGIRAYFAGQWNEAVASYENARSAAARAGDQWMATIAAANVAEILSDQGRLAEAEPRVLDVLRTLRATGARGALSFGQGLYGRLLARSGRFGEALDQYNAARTLQVADGEQVLLLETDVRIAECLAWQGIYGAALQASGEALSKVESVPGASGLVPLAHRVRGLALGGLGDIDGGLAAVRSSISAARERSAPHEVAWSLDVLLMLGDARSDGSDGPEGGGLEESIADAESERGALADMLGITAFPHQNLRRSRGLVLDAEAVDPTSVA